MRSRLNTPTENPSISHTHAACPDPAVRSNPACISIVSACASTIPGAGLYRQFTATAWTFDTKVTYSVPSGLGQNLYFAVFFGPPSGNTYVSWLRHRDDGYGVNDLELWLSDSGSALPGSNNFGQGPPPCPAETCFVRITRSGQQVTVLLSSDGVNFTTLANACQTSQRLIASLRFHGNPSSSTTGNSTVPRPIVVNYSWFSTMGRRISRSSRSSDSSVAVERMSRHFGCSGPATRCFNPRLN